MNCNVRQWYCYKRKERNENNWFLKNKDDRAIHYLTVFRENKIVEKNELISQNNLLTFHARAEVAWPSFPSSVRAGYSSNKCFLCANSESSCKFEILCFYTEHGQNLNCDGLGITKTINHPLSSKRNYSSFISIFKIIFRFCKIAELQLTATLSSACISRYFWQTQSLLKRLWRHFHEFLYLTKILEAFFHSLGSNVISPRKSKGSITGLFERQIVVRAAWFSWCNLGEILASFSCLALKKASSVNNELESVSIVHNPF